MVMRRRTRSSGNKLVITSMMTEVFTHNYGHFDLLPNEMVINILISIDVNTLFDCRLVCKRWQKLIDTYVFQEKAFRENKFVNNGQGYYSFSQISANDVRRLDLPWYVFYIICKYDPFNRNLVKNHCGQYGWKYWESNNDSFSSQNDLNCFWTVEQIPQSAHLMLDDSNFDGHTSCFSSYEKRSLTKDQEIVFKDHGLNDNIMKTLQPQIAVSAWYRCANHAAGKYTLRVYLNNASKHLLQAHIISKKMSEDRISLWNKVSYMFQTEGNESYLTISHYMENRPQFPLLLYVIDGFKVSGSVIKILLPSKFKSK